MLFKLLQRLDRTQFEPLVISLTNQGEIGPRIEALGISVHALGMKPGFPNPLKFFKLVKLLRQIQPDVVHTWMYHADLFGGLAARLANIRAVAWCLRNSDLSKSRSKKSTRLVVWASAHVSSWLPLRILSCSRRARDIHIEAGYDAAKMDLIPNGFDLEFFVPSVDCRLSVRKELGLDGDVLLVGLIGRYDPQKNHLGFVEAASRVHKELPEAHFVLAGTGVDNDNTKLMQSIAEVGLQQQFHLLGRREDIPRLMAALDVLASPSFGEAFPNVLGEAMACEIPCVVTDVGDSAEIVGGTGRVVASGDMEKMAEQLIEILLLPSKQRLKLGRQARERVRQCYEIGEVARRYEDFYLQLSEVS